MMCPTCDILMVHTYEDDYRCPICKLTVLTMKDDEYAQLEMEFHELQEAGAETAGDYDISDFLTK